MGESVLTKARHEGSQVRRSSVAAQYDHNSLEVTASLPTVVIHVTATARKTLTCTITCSQWCMPAHRHDNGKTC